jgi:hypothetical protein
MDDPRIHADDGTRRERDAGRGRVGGKGDRETCLGHDSFEDLPDDGVDPEAFFYAGVEIREGF